MLTFLELEAALEQTCADLTLRVQTLAGQLQGLPDAIEQLEQLRGMIANTLQSHQTSIDQLTESHEEIRKASGDLFESHQASIEQLSAAVSGGKPLPAKPKAPAAPKRESVTKSVTSARAQRRNPFGIPGL